MSKGLPRHYTHYSHKVHDAFCPNSQMICTCDLIAQVRRDQMRRCLSVIEEADRRLEFRDGDRENYLEGLGDALFATQQALDQIVEMAYRDADRLQN